MRLRDAQPDVNGLLDANGSKNVFAVMMACPEAAAPAGKYPDSDILKVEFILRGTPRQRVMTAV